MFNNFSLQKVKQIRPHVKYRVKCLFNLVTSLFKIYITYYISYKGFANELQFDDNAVSSEMCYDVYPAIRF